MKKIPSVGFALENILRRRRWTDDELLHSSFARSIGVVKAMQSKGLITPGKYQKPNGKKARSWTLEDVLLVNVIVGIGETSGFSLNASVAIAQKLGREWLLEAACIPSSVEQYWEQWDALTDKRKQQVADGGKTDFTVKAYPTKQLIVRDRSFISRSDNGIDEEFVGFLLDATTNKPTLLDPMETSNLSNIETSELRINCGMLTDGAWYFLSAEYAPSRPG